MCNYMYCTYAREPEARPLGWLALKTCTCFLLSHPPPSIPPSPLTWHIGAAQEVFFLPVLCYSDWSGFWGSSSQGGRGSSAPSCAAAQPPLGRGQATVGGGEGGGGGEEEGRRGKSEGQRKRGASVCVCVCVLPWCGRRSSHHMFVGHSTRFRQTTPPGAGTFPITRHACQHQYSHTTSDLTEQPCPTLPYPHDPYSVAY